MNLLIESPRIFVRLRNELIFKRSSRVRKKTRFFWISIFTFFLLTLSKPSRATFQPIYQSTLSQLDKEYIEYSKKLVFEYENFLESLPNESKIYLLSQLRMIHEQYNLELKSIAQNFNEKKIKILNNIDKYQAEILNLNQKIYFYKEDDGCINSQDIKVLSPLEEEKYFISKSLRQKINHFFQKLKKFKRDLKQLNNFDRGMQLEKRFAREILKIKDEFNTYLEEKKKELELEIDSFSLEIFEFIVFLSDKKNLFQNIEKKISENTEMHQVYYSLVRHLIDSSLNLLKSYSNIYFNLKKTPIQDIDLTLFNEFEKHKKDYEMAYERFENSWLHVDNSDGKIIEEFFNFIKNLLNKNRLIQFHKNKFFESKEKIELSLCLRKSSICRSINHFQSNYLKTKEEFSKKEQQLDLTLSSDYSNKYKKFSKFLNIWLRKNKDIKTAEFVVEQLWEMALGPQGIEILELMEIFLYKNKILEIIQNLNQKKEKILKIKEELLKVEKIFFEECDQKYQIFQARKHELLSYFNPQFSELFKIYQKKIKLAETEKKILSKILSSQSKQSKDQENLKSRVRNYQRSVEELETQVKEFKTTEKREYIEFSSFFNFVRNFKRDPIQRELKLESYQGQKVVEHLIVSVSDKRALASSWYRSLAQNQAVFDWRNVSHVSEAFGSSLSESEFDEFKEALFVKSMESMSCHFYLAKLENGQSAYLVELLGEFYWITSTGELEVVSSEFSVDTLFRVDSYQVKEEVGWE